MIAPKIHVFTGPGRSVTIPDGKYWIITDIFNGGCGEVGPGLNVSVPTDLEEENPTSFFTVSCTRGSRDDAFQSYGSNKNIYLPNKTEISKIDMQSLPDGGDLDDYPNAAIAYLEFNNPQ